MFLKKVAFLVQLLAEACLGLEVLWTTQLGQCLEVSLGMVVYLAKLAFLGRRVRSVACLDLEVFWTTQLGLCLEISLEMVVYLAKLAFLVRRVRSVACLSLEVSWATQLGLCLEVSLEMVVYLAKLAFLVRRVRSVVCLSLEVSWATQLGLCLEVSLEVVVYLARLAFLVRRVRSVVCLDLEVFWTTQLGLSLEVSLEMVVYLAKLAFLKGLVGGTLLGKDGLLGGTLQGVLGGNLLGLEDLLKGSGNSKEPFSWWNAMNLEIVRGSWKVASGTDLILSLQGRVVLNFPGSLRFLSGSYVEINITAHLAMVQDKPGDLRLVLKNCADLARAFTIQLRKSLLTNLISGGINAAIRTVLPTMICPIFQVWFSLVNQQLHILNDYVFFGLLGKIHAVLSSMPVATGQFSEIDLKDKPFPGAFIQWLLKYAGPVTSQKPS
uniref:Uncharacterized protein n=1 Tax=Sphaerodactylus townsendi TaxID=933632 RepID=A0ACB8F8E2_9SAUR